MKPIDITPQDYSKPFIVGNALIRPDGSSVQLSLWEKLSLRAGITDAQALGKKHDNGPRKE